MPEAAEARSAGPRHIMKDFFTERERDLIEREREKKRERERESEIYIYIYVYIYSTQSPRPYSTTPNYSNSNSTVIASTLDELPSPKSFLLGGSGYPDQPLASFARTRG